MKYLSSLKVWIITALLLFSALLLYVWGGGGENRDRLSARQAAGLAQTLLKRSEAIERACVRYAGLDKLDETLTVGKLQAAGFLAPDFPSPILGMDLKWEIHELPLGIGKYKFPQYLMLQVFDLPPQVCQQMNRIVFGNPRVLNITQASPTGFQVGTLESDIARANSTPAGCYNYNPEIGTYRENVFIRFIPTFEF